MASLTELVAQLTQTAANVSQIDLATKPTCRVATTANITLSGLQTIDSVVLSAGDRVLVKDQTLKATNGIYVAAVGTWTRALDFATSSQVRGGVLIPISEGTLNANSVLMLTTNDPITLGTTELDFTLHAKDSYYLVDAGTANALSVTIPKVPALTSWSELVGIQLIIKVAASVTGAATLAVTGLSGTKAIKKSVSSALESNDLLIGGIYAFIYDGTNIQVALAAKGDKGDTGTAGGGIGLAQVVMLLAQITPPFSFVGVNFTETDLSNGDFTGLDFENASFVRANLTGVNFTGANLTGANFYQATLLNFLYDITTVFHVMFTSVTLLNLTFDGIDFTDSDFAGSVFNGSSMKNCILTGVNFNGCSFDGVDLTGSTMPSVLNTKAAFKSELFSWDPVTTLWIDGTPLGE